MQRDNARANAGVQRGTLAGPAPTPPTPTPPQWANALFGINGTDAIDDGGKVTNCPDAINPARTWTQTSSLNRFNYDAAIPNIRTIPGNCWIARNAEGPGLGGAEDLLRSAAWTICIRMQSLASIVENVGFNPTRNYIWLQNSPFSEEIRFGVVRSTGTGNIYGSLISAGNPAITQNSLIGAVSTRWVTLQARVNNAGSELWIDGVLKTSAGAYTTKSATTASLRTYGLNADYGEVMSYTRYLTDSEMLDWHNYYTAIYA